MFNSPYLILVLPVALLIKGLRAGFIEVAHQVASA
jgi:hypothetical protein